MGAQPQSPGDLAAEWRSRAALLDAFGDPNSARLWRLAATELDQALRALGQEALTLVEAASVSGFTADHLGYLVRTGKLPNYGRKNAPRVRRSDLPTKAATGPGRPRKPSGELDVRSIVAKALRKE